MLSLEGGTFVPAIYLYCGRLCYLLVAFGVLSSFVSTGDRSAKQKSCMLRNSFAHTCVGLGSGVWEVWILLDEKDHNIPSQHLEIVQTKEIEI
jgi:hypothetical protein